MHYPSIRHEVQQSRMYVFCSEKEAGQARRREVWRERKVSMLEYVTMAFSLGQKAKKMESKQTNLSLREEAVLVRQQVAARDEVLRRTD